MKGVRNLSGNDQMPDPIKRSEKSIARTPVSTGISNHDQFDRGQARYLTETEVAHELKVSVKLLQKWRVEGGGPRFHKFGSTVRYARLELAAFEDAHIRTNTSGGC
jgi:hypothetical protein